MFHYSSQFSLTTFLHNSIQNGLVQWWVSILFYPSFDTNLPLTHNSLDDSDQAQAYNTYNGQQEHDPSVIHELIAGAASYEAAKAYENHVAQNGTYTSIPLPPLVAIRYTKPSQETQKGWYFFLSVIGEPESHAKAKEILAGFAGAFVDREVETRGLDFFDKERAKYQAREQVHEAYDNNGNQF